MRGEVVQLALTCFIVGCGKTRGRPAATAIFLIVLLSCLLSNSAYAQSAGLRTSGEVATAGGPTLSPGLSAQAHVVWGRLVAVGPALVFEWFPKPGGSTRGGREPRGVLEYSRALMLGPLLSFEPGRFRLSAFVGIGPGSSSVQRASDLIEGYDELHLRAQLSAGYVVARISGFEVALTAHAMTHVVFWGGGLGVSVVRDFGRGTSERRRAK